MDLVVVTERRFVRDGRGQVWCTDGSRGYQFWSRYLVAFERVFVVARVAQESGGRGAELVAGERVQVKPVADFRGALGMVVARRRVQASMAQLLGRHAAFLLRVPGALAQIAYETLVARQIPFGLEVVGDPDDVFAPGSFCHPLRPLLRKSSVHYQRIQCQRAVAVSYVTENRLQQKYPAGRHAFQASYSSVHLPDEAYAASRRFERFDRAVQIVTVGNMQRRYKGFHLLIDAVSELVKCGLDVRLTIVGDGQHRVGLEARSRSLQVANRITFAGRLPAGRAIRQVLDQADLFVLPSLTEGLPRAMIEAMARGLPCLGSNVGGIPELLAPSSLFPPGNAQAIAQAMRNLLADPGRLTQESAVNLDRAGNFHEAQIAVRRNQFYCELKARSQAAAQTRKAA